MLKDPLVRRFVSGSCFAGAFVWVAVRFFHVETDVVWVLFVMSFVLVGLMMAAGLIMAPLIRFFRSEPTMLGNLEDASAETVEEPAEETNRSSVKEGE